MKIAYIIVFLISLFYAVFYPYACWCSVAANGSDFLLRHVMDPAFRVVLFVMLLVNGWFLFKFVKFRLGSSGAPNRRDMINMFLIESIFIGGFYVGYNSGEAVRHNGFKRMATNATPIIAALARFETKHGTSPAKLAELVPEFMASIPQTGIAAYSSYNFRKGFVSADFGSNAWVLFVPVGESRPENASLIYIPNQRYGYDFNFIFATSAGKWAVVTNEVK